MCRLYGCVVGVCVCRMWWLGDWWIGNGRIIRYTGRRVIQVDDLWESSWALYWWMDGGSYLSGRSSLTVMLVDVLLMHECVLGLEMESEEALDVAILYLH